MEVKPDIRPFLQDVAEDLLRQFGNNLSSLCVVFPNKRARLFFSRYLAESAGGRTVWAPAYRTITELVQEFSGLTLADKTQLNFELFSVFKKTTGAADNFDDFYYYSEMLLADFEEIDKSMVNAHDLFSNLSDQKSMESSFDYLSENQLNAIKKFWNSFNPGRISNNQQEFLKFWDLLYDIYEAYRQQLKEKKLAYEGMIYREVSAMIQGSGTLNFSFTYYVLVGFNALNACEEILFGHLKKTGKSLFYWDYDEYYTKNEWHEAGYFIRDNCRRYPAPDPSKHYSGLTSASGNITVLPVSSTTAQAKILPAVFRMIGLSENSDYRHTALVLPDEKLMLPVLYSIPSHVRDINITMGYPLKESSVYAFIELIYTLYRNASGETGKRMAFYHKDLVAFLKHPFIYNHNKDIADKLISDIRENNRAYIGIEDLQKVSEFQLFFRHVNTAPETVSYLSDLLELSLRNLLKPGNNKTDPLQLECIYQAYQGIRRLSEILGTTDLTFSSQLLFRLIRKIFRGMAVPFAGEPLAGLQILGILETRLLDFENIVILSMNEGIMPRSLPLSSFIPRNLRFGFGMPVPEHYDAVYAYYFYRLIQRAKNVFLIYNESADGLVTGEPSRYIHQLVYEPPFHVKEVRLEAKLHEIPAKPIVIEKTTGIIAKLDRYLDGNSASWLSPSAINEFINCPLKFYYHRIANVNETEEIAEDVDPLIFGNLLHGSMHELYKPFTGKDIDRAIITNLIQQENKLEDILSIAFDKEFYKSGTGQERKLTGMNLIIKEIIRKYVLQILNADLNNCPFHIISLEEEYRTAIPVMDRARERRMQIGGIIDRVDQYHGITRIIDYKTGMENLYFGGLESLFSAIPSKRNDAAFQVLLYAYLYRRKFPDNPVIPCLVFSRKSNKPDFSWHLKDQSDHTEVLEFTRFEKLFGEGLKSSLEKLIDPTLPFIQTSDEDFCALCAYRGICHR